MRAAFTLPLTKRPRVPTGGERKERKEEKGRVFLSPAVGSKQDNPCRLGCAVMCPEGKSDIHEPPSRAGFGMRHRSGSSQQHSKFPVSVTTVPQEEMRSDRGKTVLTRG